MVKEGPGRKVLAPTLGSADRSKPDDEGAGMVY